MKSTLAIPLLAALSVFAQDVHNKPAKRHHHDLAARNNGVAKVETQNLQKRDFSGVATWYDVTTGQGYCGGYRSPGDFVVALNQPQMDAQSVRCGDTVTISANGRTAVATVWDECPPCAWGSLDLSQGLFQYFSDLGAGVIPITWYVGAGGGQPQPQPQPTSTYVWTPDPTPTPSSTPPPPSSSSSSSSSSAPPSSESSSAENTVQEVPTTTSAPPENLNNANNAILQFAEILRLARNGAA